VSCVSAIVDCRYREDFVSMRLPICWNRSSSSAGVFHIALFCITLISAMPRRSQHIEIPSNSIGIRRGITVHHYGERSSHTSKNAYIQASLHADEIPGLNKSSLLPFKLTVNFHFLTNTTCFSTLLRYACRTPSDTPARCC
jgi:hypothetical protein